MKVRSHEMPSDSSFEPWRFWLAANGPKFLLFARQQTRSEADAQDLLQDVILSFWREKPNELPEVPLVFHRIRLRAIDLARTEDRRRVREDAASGEIPVAWFDRAVEAREAAAEIQAALAQIAEPYREVIMLKIWGELTFDEIGRALSISPNTAASRYRYGLEALRAIMRSI